MRKAINLSLVIFFFVVVRFVQRAPSVFFQEEMSAQLFECGLVGLEVDHVDANRSVTKFFSECITSVQMARKVGLES